MKTLKERYETMTEISYFEAELHKLNKYNELKIIISDEQTKTKTLNLDIETINILQKYLAELREQRFIHVRNLYSHYLTENENSAVAWRLAVFNAYDNEHITKSEYDYLLTKEGAA